MPTLMAIFTVQNLSWNTRCLLFSPTPVPPHSNSKESGPNIRQLISVGHLQGRWTDSTKHLANFQRRSRNAESSILQHDAGYVGGYGQFLWANNSRARVRTVDNVDCEWLFIGHQYVEKKEEFSATNAGSQMHWQHYASTSLQAESCGQDTCIIEEMKPGPATSCWTKGLDPNAGFLVLYGKLTNHGNEGLCHS